MLLDLVLELDGAGLVRYLGLAEHPARQQDAALALAAVLVLDLLEAGAHLIVKEVRIACVGGEVRAAVYEDIRRPFDGQESTGMG